MGCQRNISRQITDSGADYVLAVKENQGQLHEGFETCSSGPRPRALTGRPMTTLRRWTGDTGRWNAGNAGSSPNRTAWTARGSGPN